MSPVVPNTSNNGNTRSRWFKAGILLGLLTGTFPALVAVKLLYAAQGAHFFAGNLFANGITCIALTWFGIRHTQKWAWYMFAFIILFVSINDLILVPKNQFPLPIIPLSAGCLCLLLTYRGIFNNREHSYRAGKGENN